MGRCFAQLKSTEMSETGCKLTGNGSLLDKNLATKNFDGIVIIGDGDGNSATLELSKNKAAENDGHGIIVTGR